MDLKDYFTIVLGLFMFLSVLWVVVEQMDGVIYFTGLDLAIQACGGLNNTNQVETYGWNCKNLTLLNR